MSAYVLRDGPVALLLGDGEYRLICAFQLQAVYKKLRVGFAWARLLETIVKALILSWVRVLAFVEHMVEGILHMLLEIDSVPLT